MPDPVLVEVVDLVPLAAAPASGDLICMVDISHPTQGAAGSVKIMTVANLFTSPTFTGTTTADALVVNGLTTATDVSDKVTIGRFSVGIPTSYFVMGAGATAFKWQNPGIVDLMTLTGSGELTVLAGITITGFGGLNIVTGDTIVQAFGCNGATAKTAAASGGALISYVTGGAGYSTTAMAQALYAMVVTIRTALVANGILS